MARLMPVLVTGNDGVSKQAAVAGVDSRMGMTACLSVDAHDKRLRSHSIFLFGSHWAAVPERVAKSI